MTGSQIRHSHDLPHIIKESTSKMVSEEKGQGSLQQGDYIMTAIISMQNRNRGGFVVAAAS